MNDKKLNSKLADQSENNSLQEKGKKFTKKKLKRKNKKANQFAQIYRQQCQIDPQPMTQKDRSELILY